MTNLVTTFDLWNVLVRDVSGSQIIFIFLSLLFIGYLASKFRMTNFITLMIMMVWGIMMSAFFHGLLIIVIYVLGALIAFFLLKIIKPTT